MNCFIRKYWINNLLGNHSNEIHRSSTHSSNHHHHHFPPDSAPYSNSSVVSGGGNERHPDNNYNKETQRAILTALTKLQRDVNNILERINRLEASTHFIKQVYRKIKRIFKIFSTKVTIELSKTIGGE